MAQLDKMIKAMFGQPGSEIALVANLEPQLHLQTGATHVLMNRKIPAPLLRQLVGELIGEPAAAQLDSGDSGEYTYAYEGNPVIVAVKAWTSSVETRIRPLAVKRAALGKIELTKARRPGPEPPAAPPSPQAPGPFVPDALELDLGSPPSPAPAARQKTGNHPVPAGLSNQKTGNHVFPASLFSPQEPGSDAAMASPATRAPPGPPTEMPSAMRAQAPSGVAFVETRADAKVTPNAGEPPINALFRTMVKQGCSDLHLSTGERPMVRRDGDIARLDESMPRFKGDQIMDLVRPIMPARNITEFDADHDTDFAYEITGISRFRANVFMDRRGVGAVFRTIPAEIATAEKLQLSAAIQNLCYLSKGLVLITGPTGSGKSTTLSALIDLINRTRHDHVITIEDPIEFVHQNKSCLINQREVGPHTDSFKRALRAALREDPDVVMVGEMRDLDTMAIAMETAETGHLVFGTLHTSTAYSTVDRLIDSFPSERQAQIRVMLSESLKGVISQTLCKKIGGGRVAAYEVMLVTSAISNLIREAKTFQIPSLMQTQRKAGMIMLNDALFELVEKKKVDAKEAYVKAIDKASFASQLRAAGHKLEFLG